MIEPINIGGALLRSWRLLIVLAVLFAAVGYLLPVSHVKAGGGPNKLRWQGVSLIGAAPTSPLGSAGSVNSATYWAANYYTKANAVAAVGQANLLGPLVNGMTALGTTTAQTPTQSTSGSHKAPQQTVVLLTVSDTTATSAAALADAYATQVDRAVEKAFQEHLTQSGATVPPGGLSSGITTLVPSSAHKIAGSKASLGSSHKVRVVVGFIIGLLVGAAIVLLREVLDKTVRTAARAERTFRYPVVAEIPDRPPVAGAQAVSPMDVVGDPGSAAAEAYRMLRMSVLFEALAAGPPAPDPYSDGLEGLNGWHQLPEPYRAPEPGSRQVVLVVSAGTEETRPMVAANLGATYAEAGQRVIVISTDDLDSGFANDSVSDASPSFGPTDLAPYLQASRLPNVTRLSLRHFVSSSGQLVTRAPDVLRAARQLADVVIVEAPPLLAVHHGEALVHAVDVVVVVAECGSTTMDEGRRASDILRRMGAPVLGVVLTKFRLSRRDIRRIPPTADQQGIPLPAPVRDALPVPEATEPEATETVPEATQA